MRRLLSFAVLATALACVGAPAARAADWPPSGADGPSLYGTVTDADGHGLADIRVTGDAPGGTSSAVTTDADGHYAFPHAAAGRWHLLFQATPDSALVTNAARGDGEGPDVVVPDGGSLAVDEQLAPGGGIAGTVGAEDGAPVGIPDAEVSGAPRPTWQIDTWTHATDPRYGDGEYAVLGLAPGTYRVQLDGPFEAPPGHPLLPRWFGGPASPVRQEDAAVVQVRAGAVTSDVSATLQRSASARGVVLDADGTPVAGAFVQGRRLDVPPDARDGLDDLYGLTNADGTYLSGPVRAGLYEVCASQGPCDPDHRAIVRLVAGQTATAAPIDRFSTPVPPPTPYPVQIPPTTPTTPAAVTPPTTSTAAEPVTPGPADTSSTPASTPPTEPPAAPPTSTTTPAAAPVPPGPSAVTAVPALRLAVRAGAQPVVTVQVPRAGTLSARMTAGGRTLGRASVRRSQAGRASLRLALTAAGRRAVRRHGTTRAVVHVTFRPTSGAATTATRTTTLRRAS